MLPMPAAGGAVLGVTDRSSVCSMCRTINATYRDPGCPLALSTQSYNKGSTPWSSPAIGLRTSSFALKFSPGPEHMSWDGPMGYPTIMGSMAVTNVTFAEWFGLLSCRDQGSLGA